MNLFIVCIIAVTTTVPFVVHAQGSSDFLRLQDNYNRAITRAVTPIDNVYRDNLKLLLQKEARNGNTQQIAIINEELRKIEDKYKLAPSGNSLSSYTNNKTWVCFNHVFKFKSDNTGEKIHSLGNVPFSWRRVNDNSIEVVGRDTPSSIPKTWIFVFSIDGKNHYLVDGEDKNEKPITLQ